MACRAYLVFLRAHMRRGLQVSLASSLDAVCAIRTLCEIQQEPQCRDVFVLLIMMASRWPSAKSCARVNDSLWDNDCSRRARIVLLYTGAFPTALACVSSKLAALQIPLLARILCQTKSLLPHHRGRGHGKHMLEAWPVCPGLFSRFGLFGLACLAWPIRYRF